MAVLPKLVYDQDCGVCGLFADWLTRRHPHRFELYGGFREDMRASGVTPELCSRYIVLLDGEHVLFGADAILAVLSLNRGLELLCRLLGVPPFIWFLRLGYRIFASQRRRISTLLGLNACRIGEKK